MAKLALMPTASRLDDAIACPASVVLPHEIRPSGEPAVRGNAAHNYLEAIAKGMDRQAALALVPTQYVDWCSMIDVDALFAGLTEITAEVPYAIDICSETCRRMRGGQREYADRTDREFVGTVDVVCLRSGTYVVRDYKTGSNLGDPYHKMQLRFAATAVHMMTDASTVVAEYVYIHEDGTHSVSSTQFSTWDFVETIEVLSKLRTDILDAASRMPNVSVATGPQCRFCPAYWSCPAQGGALLKAGSINDSGEMSQVWAAYEQARIAIDRVKPLVNDYVDQHGIDMPDGTVVRMYSTTKRAANVGKLVKLARGRGASDDDISDCYYDNTTTYPRQVKRKA